MQFHANLFARIDDRKPRIGPFPARAENRRAGPFRVQRGFGQRHVGDRPGQFAVSRQSQGNDIAVVVVASEVQRRRKQVRLPRRLTGLRKRLGAVVSRQPHRVPDKPLVLILRRFPHTTRGDVPPVARHRVQQANSGRIR